MPKSSSNHIYFDNSSRMFITLTRTDYNDIYEPGHNNQCFSDGNKIGRRVSPPYQSVASHETWVVFLLHLVPPVSCL